MNVTPERHVERDASSATQTIWSKPVKLTRPAAILLLLLAPVACHSPTGSAVFADEPQVPVPVPITEATHRIDAIEAHMDYVTEYAFDEFGPKDELALWLANIDIRKATLPKELQTEGNSESKPFPQRPVSNLYLDQPTILAAMELGKRTGCKCYSDAAEIYISDWLDRAKEDARIGKRFGFEYSYNVITDQFEPTGDDAIRELPPRRHLYHRSVLDRPLTSRRHRRRCGTILLPRRKRPIGNPWMMIPPREDYRKPQTTT